MNNQISNLYILFFYIAILYNKYINCLLSYLMPLFIGSFNEIYKLKDDPDAIIFNLSNNEIVGKTMIFNVLNFNDKILTKNDSADYLITVADIVYLIHNVYIKNCKNSNKNIFINCHSGINRSALIISAYNVLIHGEDPIAVIANIRKLNYEKNRPALTNCSFRILLYILYHSRKMI